MTILELEKIEKGLSALEAELEASKTIVNNEVYTDFINSLRKQIDDLNKSLLMMVITS